MSFWKKLAIAAAVVVAVAVVAAVVTVATGGTATAALCAVGSTFLGAAKGAVVGAVTGAVGGAVTGAVTGAIEGYQEAGTLEGTLKGMGRGAAKGAVQGAQDGLVSGLVMGGIAGAINPGTVRNPSCCFVAGTTVLTSLGKKTIESIKVGDVVPCIDHITGESAEKRVTSTSVRKIDRLIELEIGDEKLQCTETHPFQVKDKGWVDAADLKPCDLIYTKDWKLVSVHSVNLIELDEPVEVFNFEVDDCHTYYLGNSYIIVHNGSCNSKFYEATRTEGGVQRGEEITRNQALQRVRSGKDVLTTSRSSAKKLVKDAFGNSRAYSEIHKNIPKAMKHFHDAANHFYHIFFT